MPRRLEFSEQREPIMEHPDDTTDSGERSHSENQVVPHPHRSGCTLDETRHDEENLKRMERKFEV